MTRDKGAYQLLYGRKSFPPPTMGEEWTRQSDFERFVEITPSEAYLGILTLMTFLVLIKITVSHQNCQHN